uniref:Uncharacterized protein n=1 Tax=Anguilla anguilla TaxID=7936 RepID=A0A0E9S574_ANGAN
MLRRVVWYNFLVWVVFFLLCFAVVHCQIIGN